MRIVAGSHKGRPLATPKTRVTRPTADRAREAIFNKLAHAPWSEGVENRRVLDLFAGSGGLGLEAMSRGAAFCLFVETDADARGAIRLNIETFQLWGATRIHRRDATALGAKPANLGAPFDLIFLDPPYRKGLGETALEKLTTGGWTTPDALAVFETAADETPLTPSWDTVDKAEYGAAQVLFLKRS